MFYYSYFFFVLDENAFFISSIFYCFTRKNSLLSLFVVNVNDLTQQNWDVWDITKKIFITRKNFNSIFYQLFFFITSKLILMLHIKMTHNCTIYWNEKETSTKKPQNNESPLIHIESTKKKEKEKNNNLQTSHTMAIISYHYYDFLIDVDLFLLLCLASFVSCEWFGGGQTTTIHIAIHVVYLHVIAILTRILPSLLATIAHSRIDEFFSSYIDDFNH